MGGARREAVGRMSEAKVCCGSCLQARMSPKVLGSLLFSPAGISERSDPGELEGVRPLDHKAEGRLFAFGGGLVVRSEATGGV